MAAGAPPPRNLASLEAELEDERDEDAVHGLADGV
jgi:hypothetical protein